MDARQAAEFAARNSYGRLVAYLVARSQDVTAAEDALGDAFLAALKTWTINGVPENPEAWLLVTARHRLIDATRQTKVKSTVIDLLDSTGFASQVEPSLEDISFLTIA
jgi:predicted RNA polymerase sigma factor